MPFRPCPTNAFARGNVSKWAIAWEREAFQSVKMQYHNNERSNHVSHAFRGGALGRNPKYSTSTAVRGI